MRDTNKKTFWMYRVTVRGRGEFPLDMLRYARLVPDGESESHNLTHTEEREVKLVRFSSERRAEAMDRTGYARFESFGWEVVRVEPFGR